MTSGKRTLELNGQELSRRRLLALTSAGVVGGVAGCLGDDDDVDADLPTDDADDADPGDDTDPGADDTQPPADDTAPDGLVDSTVDMMDSATPEEVNLNRFALQTAYHWIVREYGGILTNSMETPDYIVYEGEGSVYEPNGTHYDADTRTWHMKVKEDEFYWANGDPITGEDLYVEFMVDQLQLPEEQRVYEDVELVSEWEFQFTLETESNPLNMPPGGQVNERIAMNYGREREWLEMLEDATTDEEREDVTAEITNTRIDVDEFIEEGMSSSVWAPYDWDEATIYFEKNEHHPYADEFVYDELVVHTCDGAACEQLMLNDRLDVGPGLYPEQLRDVSPDHLQTVSQSRSLTARNMYFRYLNDHMANPWVRRAMLTVLDLEFLVDFWQGEGGFVKQHQTGMMQADENRLLEPEFVDQLYDYPLGGDEELAAEFMREGGYERNGSGLWENGDGETVEFDFAPPSGSLFEPLGNAMNDMWQGFGLEPQITFRAFDYLTPNLQEGTGDVDVTLWATGWQRGIPADYFSPQNPFFLHLYTPGTDNHEQWLDEGLEVSPNNGRPIVVEIPEDPGDIFLEGSTKEINLLEHWEEFIEIQDEERSMEIIRDFVTYFNSDLPRPDLFPQINAIWGNTQNWNWPDDHDYYHVVQDQAQHLVHRFGVMQGRVDD